MPWLAVGPSLTSSAAVSAEPRELELFNSMDVLRCGCFPGNFVSGTISFASFVDGSVCKTGHMTHAVALLCSVLLGWCSLRPFCSLEWHVVDGRARSDDVPTGRSTCISSVLDRAQGVEGQLVIMPFIVDEGHQPLGLDKWVCIKSQPSGDRG